MKAAPTPNPNSFFLFAIRFVISILVESVNDVPYFVLVDDSFILLMIGFKAVKLLVLGGDQSLDERLLED